MSYALELAPRQAAAGRSVRRTGFALAGLAVPLFALVALALGKEASWDLQNYHWYDPYAFLTGRLGFDVAPAHHATYYNPLIDVPFFLLARHFPAWVAGAWLGGLAGVACALLGAIAYRLIPLPDRRHRLAAACLLALAGLCGGGAMGEIGKTSDDIASGLGILGGLLVLAAFFVQTVRASRGDLLTVLIPAGFLVGASVGLKLTTAPYAIGLGVALLTLSGSPLQRIGRAGAFGVGAALGVAVFGGFWFWTMWRFSGNPVFPYFNGLFPSPLVPPGDYRDGTFLPKSWEMWLLFPFAFSLHSDLVAEVPFRDVHIAIAYLLIPATGLAALLGAGARDRMVDPLAARLLLVMASVTYVPWLVLFAIYRYLVPLEMLSPLIIALAVALLPWRRPVRIGVAAALLAVAQAVAWGGSGVRHSWAGPYVEIAVPRIADPAGTLVLMTATAPMAYAIPEFPTEIPFLRIQSYLVSSKDDQFGLGRAMHLRVAQHSGPIFVLFWPAEIQATTEALNDYGLTLDKGGCQTVTSSVEEFWNQGKSLEFCPAAREGR